jgi:hypothetical protein
MPRSTNLSFLPSLKYNEFGHKFLHSSRSHYYLHLEIFVLIFLKFTNTIFEKFKKQAPWSSGSICPCSMNSPFCHCGACGSRLDIQVICGHARTSYLKLALATRHWYVSAGTSRVNFGDDEIMRRGSLYSLCYIILNSIVV